MCYDISIMRSISIKTSLNSIRQTAAVFFGFTSFIQAVTPRMY